MGIIKNSIAIPSWIQLLPTVKMFQLRNGKHPRERAKRKQTVKQYTDEVNKKFAEHAGMTFLAEDESFRGFQRKRLAQPFDKPTAKKFKSHSPNFENVDGMHSRSLVISEPGQKM